MTRLEKCKLAVEKGYTYDPISGNVYGLNGNIINKKCGPKNRQYITICFKINKKQFSLKAHQFAWYIVYGSTVERIDHIIGVTGQICDNRINNLRSVTRQQNGFNQTGRKGFSKKGKKYITRISTYDGRINVGSYDTPEEAHKHTWMLKRYIT